MQVRVASDDVFFSREYPDGETPHGFIDCHYTRRELPRKRCVANKSISRNINLP